MRKLTAIFCAGAVLMAAVSCEPQQTETPLSEVSLSIGATTSGSIEFTVTPDENAVCFYYTCVPSADTLSASYTRVDDAAPVTVTEDGLAEEVEYTVMAYAENIAGMPGPVAKATAFTTSAPQISVTLIESASTTVRFKISAVNADGYSYGVLRSSEAADGSLTGRSENTEETEYAVDTLAPMTSYAIVAQAENAAGETSERKMVAFKTDVLPVVEVGEITADLTSAVISLSWKDSYTVYYALVPNGTEPEEYMTIRPEGGATEDILSFYELTGDTEYTFMAFGESEKGNCGDTVSVNFITTDVDSDHKVTVSDVSSYDAKFTATWDTGKYSGCWWYAGLSSELDPSSFDWDDAISTYKARRAYNGSKVSLSSFSPVSSECYMVGFIFLDTEGNPVPESVIWKEVQLDQISFGDSDCTVEIEEVSVSYSMLRYIITGTGAAQYYMGVTPKQSIDDLNEYALSVLKSSPSNIFGEIMYRSELLSDMEYTAVVIPVDEDGRFGMYTTLDFRTEAEGFNGSGEMEVSLKNASWCSATFDVQLGDNTQRGVYYYSLTPLGSEEEIFEALDLASKQELSIPESGDLKVVTQYNNAYTNVVQYVAFAAIDEAGRLSSLQTFETPLKDLVFDGTGEVAFRIDNVAKSGQVYLLDYTMTPSDEVDYYYYRIVNNFTNDYLTDERIAVEFITLENSYTPVYGELSTNSPKGSEPSPGANSYILIMPVDKSGRLCTPIRQLIEETAE